MKAVVVNDSFFIDEDAYLIYRNGKAFTVPKKEFELLSLLNSKPGKVFRREEIFQAIWSKETDITSRTIDVHIRRIRQRFGEELIRTVIGVGYKLVV